MLVEEDTNIKHRTCVTHMIVFGLTRHCRLHPWLALTLLAHVTILHTFIGAPHQTRKISPQSGYFGNTGR